MRGLRWVLGGLTVLAGLSCLDFGALAEDQSGIEKLEARIIQGSSVGELIAYAYRSSPSIQMAREDWSAIVQRYRVTTAYPDPQVMISYFPEPIETRLGPQDWNVTVTQMVPFPGKLSKAGEIVDAEARIARLDLDRAVREVIVKIRESYHELLYIQEAKKVVAQNRDLLENLRKVAESSYAQGRAAFVDVVKAQSQSAQLQYDAILLEDLEETEKSRLNSLMSRSPDAQIGTLTGETPLPLIYDLKEIYGMAEKYQEEIQMAEAMIDKATAGLDLARYENLPDFKFGLFYAGIGDPDVPVRPPDAGHDAVGVQFGLSIPLWSGKNEGRVAEARAKEQRARAMKESRINESFAQIRNLYFRLMNSQRLVKLYRDQLLPQAAESIEMAETRIYPNYSLNLSLYQDEAISQVGTWRKKEPFAVPTSSPVGAGLPKMPWYGTGDAYLREVRERLQALHSELQKVKDATLTQVREAWFRHDLAKRQERLYAKKVVNLSQAALEVSTRGYETGKVSFADVISSYTTWLKFHLALERHRSDLGLAHAGLEEAVGASWKEQGESLGGEKE